MKFQHVFRNMVPTNTLKNFAEPKIEKLEQITDGAHRAKLTYEYDKGIFKVKVEMTAKNHHPIFAEDNHKDIFVAIDNNIAKIERQLIKEKDKMKGRRHHTRAREFMPELEDAV